MFENKHFNSTGWFQFASEILNDSFMSMCVASYAWAYYDAYKFIWFIELNEYVCCDDDDDGVIIFKS